MKEEKEKLKAAIAACADKAARSTTPLDALQFSQAALNAAHALSTLVLNIKE